MAPQNIKQNPELELTEKTLLESVMDGEKGVERLRRYEPKTVFNQIIDLLSKIPFNAEGLKVRDRAAAQGRANPLIGLWNAMMRHNEAFRHRVDFDVAMKALESTNECLTQFLGTIFPRDPRLQLHLVERLEVYRVSSGKSDDVLFAEESTKAIEKGMLRGIKNIAPDWGAEFENLLREREE